MDGVYAEGPRVLVLVFSHFFGSYLGLKRSLFHWVFGGVVCSLACSCSPSSGSSSSSSSCSSFLVLLSVLSFPGYSIHSVALLVHPGPLFLILFCLSFHFVHLYLPFFCAHRAARAAGSPWRARWWRCWCVTWTRTSWNAPPLCKKKEKKERK